MYHPNSLDLSEDGDIVIVGRFGDVALSDTSLSTPLLVAVDWWAPKTGFVDFVKP